MICRITSKRTSAFLMIAAMMILSLTWGAGAVPVEEWNKTFGAYWDEAYSVQQTPDGGYIIEGYTIPYGNGNQSDTWLIKTDAYGDEEWNRTFGVISGIKISPTSDGGYMLKWWSGQDFRVMKTDANGQEQWNKTYTKDMAPLGVKKGKYQVNSVEETADGGFIYAGFNMLSQSTSDWHMRIVKVDVYGNEQWNITSQRSQGDIADSAQQTSDGGYIISGATESGALVLKLDAKGNQQWEKILGTKGEARAVLQTSDSGYIILDNVNSDISLIKMDATGNEQWNRTFGGQNGDVGFSIQKTSDDGYILAGYTKSYGAGDRDAWLIKTDAYGNQQWNKEFGGSMIEQAYSVKETYDGGYIFAGFTESYGARNGDAWVVKIRDPSTSAAAIESTNTISAIETTTTVPAIGTTVPDTNKPAEKSTPGFEIIGAMVSVIILFLLMWKRT